MIDSVFQFFKNNPQLKSILKVVLVLAVALLVLVLFWPEKNYTQYKVLDTGVQTSSGNPYVHDSKYYSYNGLAFYSQDLKGGSKPKVLFSGLKLPEVDKMAWAGDKGVLISFKAPLYSTDIDTKLRSLGEKSDDITENYTWYLDFSTGSLDVFDTAKLNTNSVLYSDKDSGFFYYRFASEEGQDDSGRSSLSISFYNVVSKEYKGVSQPLSTSRDYSLTHCQEDKFIACIIAQDDKDEKQVSLNGVDSNGNFAKLISNDTAPIATNDPDYYLTVGSDSKVFMNRISNGKSQEIKLKLADPEPVAYIGAPVQDKPDSRHIYVLDNSLSEEPDSKGKATPYAYVSGEINTTSLETRFKDYDAKIGKEYFKERIINSNGFSDISSSVSLLNSFKGQSFMFVPKDADFSQFTPLSEVDEKKVVNHCVDKPENDIQYFGDSKTFRILIDYHQDIKARITSFTDCVESSNPSALYGYKFTAFLVDPATGRLVE